MPAHGSAAARRYARALLALAAEADGVEAVRSELAELVELVDGTPELRQAVARPLFPAAERRAVIERLTERLGSSALLRSFLLLLIDKRRMLELGSIRAAFEHLADEAAGRTHAEVVSASPLAPESLERVREALGRHTGRDVEIALRVEPELLGGVVARVGDLVFDGSLRTQLARVRASLTKG